MVDFERADEPLGLGRIERRCGSGVESVEFVEEDIGAFFVEPRFETSPDVGWNRRDVGQAELQGVQVQCRAADDQRKASPIYDVADALARLPGECSRRKRRAEVDFVDKVLRDAGAFFGRRFGRPDDQFAIDLPAVGGNDLSAEPLGQLQAQRRLPDRRRPGYDGKRSCIRTICNYLRESSISQSAIRNLVRRHRRVDFAAPGQDAASEVFGLLEAEGAQILHRLRRPRAGAAVHHDQGVFVILEFVDPVRE